LIARIAIHCRHAGLDKQGESRKLRTKLLVVDPENSLDGANLCGSFQVIAEMLDRRAEVGTRPSSGVI